MIEASSRLPIWSQISIPQHSVPGMSDSSRRTFLFVHGDFATGPMTWSKQWNSLGTTHQLIVVDRRGHGESPTKPTPYTIRGDAEDILHVMDSVDANETSGPIALVGHSYGAMVALEVALLQPDRIAALHLIEPPYLSILPDDPEVARLAEATKRLHEEAKSISAQRLTEKFFALVMGDAGLRVIKEKPVWHLILAQAERFANEQFVGEYPAERFHDLADHLPLALYSGGQSHPALRRVTRHLHILRPGSTYHFFPEAGHDVQRIGDPFNELLLAA